jgi:hypothetical protein
MPKISVDNPKSSREIVKENITTNAFWAFWAAQGVTISLHVVDVLLQNFLDSPDLTDKMVTALIENETLAQLFQTYLNYPHAVAGSLGLITMVKFMHSALKRERESSKNKFTKYATYVVILSLLAALATNSIQ